MQLGNPLPIFLGIPLMASVCWVIARWFPILERATSSNEILPLDGLRGILASAVLFNHAYIAYVWFHTGLWLVPRSSFYAQLGSMAVQMFFFISGYLFWRKMLRDPGSLRPQRLLLNRARRILPAYLMAIAAFFALSAWLTHFQILVPVATLLREGVSALLSGLPVPTAAIASGRVSFNTLDAIVVSGGIFWTLQQEWLFYFLLPCLSWFRPLGRLFLLPVLFLAAHRLLTCGWVIASVGLGVRLFLAKFLEVFLRGFIIGMVAAYDLPKGRFRIALRSPWMASAAALLLACYFLLLSKGGLPFGPVNELVLVPLFFMIIAGNRFWGLLSSTPMRCLGTVSYSFYVFHGILLHFCTSVIDRYHPIRFMAPLPYWICIVGVGLLIAAWSTFSYQVIERPFFVRKAVP